MLNKMNKIRASVFLAAQIGSFGVSANPFNPMSISNPSQSESFIKKISLNNGFEYIGKIKYSSEFSTTDENGNKIYKRTVSTTGEFFDVRGKKPTKIMFQKMVVTFTYDKNGHVWISNNDEDISYSKKTYGEKKWKLIHNHEVFNSASQCIVSSVFTVYKNPKMARHAVYIDNGHLDIICSPDGVITFNSKASL